MANRMDYLRMRKIVPGKKEETIHHLTKDTGDGEAIFTPVYNKNKKPDDFIFSNVNPIFEKLIGLDSEEIISKKLTDILKEIGKEPAIWISKFQKCFLTAREISFNECFKDHKKVFLLKVYRVNNSVFLKISKKTKSSSISKKEKQIILKEFEMLNENNLVAFCRLRLKDRKVIYTNKASADFFGYASQEDFIREFHPKKHYVDLSVDEKIIEKTKDKEYIENIKIHFKKKDGSLFWMLSSYKLDSSGEYIDYIGTDISYQQELKKEEVLNNIILENIYSAIIITDLDYNILKINKSAKKLYGWEIQETIGKKISQLAPSEYISESRESALKYFNKHCFWNGLIIQRSKNNKKIYIESSANLVEDMDIIITINRDVTKSIRIEKQKDKAIKELKRVRNIQDQIAVVERAKLERELHDTVTQNIFAASILAESLYRTWQKDIKQGKKQIKMMRKVINEAYTEIRRIILSLHSSRTLKEDLSKSLKRLINEYRDRITADISMDLDHCCDFNKHVKKAIFRIVQENLNNIVKHSRATKVSIVLRCSKKKFLLNIKDNGIGFVVNKINPKSLGLIIMKERARLIGASLDVVSKKGKGAEVNITNKYKLSKWLAK